MPNGDDGRARLLNWFMAVATALLVAAVAGLWKMSAEVAHMSATMEAWSGTFRNVEMRVHEIEMDHKKGQHDTAARRLDRIEDLHGPGSHHMDRKYDRISP